MSVIRPRYLYSFTSSDNLHEYIFPRYGFEADKSQPLSSAYATVVGADYAVDRLGLLTLPKQVGVETARFLVYNPDPVALNVAYDELMASMYRWGFGKLRNFDGLTYRWAWARLHDVPTVNLKGENFRFFPVVCAFDRLSDWYDETMVDVLQTITVAPFTFVVTNTGTLDALNVTFRFMANGATGINKPTLTNQTTGESFTSTYVSSSVNSELRVDTGRYAVETSENNGTSYANAYDTFTMGDLQVGFMRLSPGPNTLQYTQALGVPNLQVETSFYPPYQN